MQRAQIVSAGRAQAQVERCEAMSAAEQERGGQRMHAGRYREHDRGRNPRPPCRQHRDCEEEAEPCEWDGPEPQEDKPGFGLPHRPLGESELRFVNANRLGSVHEPRGGVSPPTTAIIQRVSPWLQRSPSRCDVMVTMRCVRRCLVSPDWLIDIIRHRLALHRHQCAFDKLIDRQVELIGHAFQRFARVAHHGGQVHEPASLVV